MSITTQHQHYLFTFATRIREKEEKKTNDADDLTSNHLNFETDSIK